MHTEQLLSSRNISKLNSILKKNNYIFLLTFNIFKLTLVFTNIKEQKYGRIDQKAE